MWNKPSATEILLKGTGLLNDYQEATKLYEQYQKEEEKGRDTRRTVEKLLPLVKSSRESLERTIRVYKSQAEAVKAEAGVGESEIITTYVPTLEACLSTIEMISADIMGEEPDEPKKPQGGEGSVSQSVSDLYKKADEGKEGYWDGYAAGLKANTAARTMAEEQSMGNTLEEILTYASTKIDEIRAKTRKRIADAGYTKQDIAEYMNRERE